MGVTPLYCSTGVLAAICQLLTQFKSLILRGFLIGNHCKILQAGLEKSIPGPVRSSLFILMECFLGSFPSKMHAIEWVNPWVTRLLTPGRLSCSGLLCPSGKGITELMVDFQFLSRMAPRGRGSQVLHICGACNQSRLPWLETAMGEEGRCLYDGDIHSLLL